MVNTNIIEQDVNINNYPLVDTLAKAEQGARISVGDFHGNAQKLLYVLTRHGFINISKHDYLRFFQIYDKDKIRYIDKIRFDEIINRIEVKPEALESLLLSIGDLVADRGSNDYFTLKLLKKLHDNRVPFLNLISNHDAEFIQAYEKGSRFDKSRLRGAQSNSAGKFQELLDLRILSIKEAKGLIDIYKKSLRVLDYSLNEEKDKITIYSHGVIGLESINFLAEKLGIKNAQCDENTPACQIAEIIEEINERFSIHIKNNSLTDLININGLSREEINGIYPILPEKFPFAHLVWNRSSLNVTRPRHINFVHGHDIKDKTCENIVNLDNILGKSRRHHSGEYHALHSRETKLALELKKEEAVELKQEEVVELKQEEVVELKQEEVVELKQEETVEAQKGIVETKSRVLAFSIIEDYQHINEMNVEKLQTQVEDELEKEWIEFENIDLESNVVQKETENTFLGYFSSWFGYNSAPVVKKDTLNLEGVEIIGKYGEPLTNDLSQSIMGVPKTSEDLTTKEEEEARKSFFVRMN